MSPEYLPVLRCRLVMFGRNSIYPVGRFEGQPISRRVSSMSGVPHQRDALEALGDRCSAGRL